MTTLVEMAVWGLLPVPPMSNGDAFGDYRGAHLDKELDDALREHSLDKRIAAMGDPAAGPREVACAHVLDRPRSSH
jgi:hypothetical protein